MERLFKNHKSKGASVFFAVVFISLFASGCNKTPTRSGISYEAALLVETKTDPTLHLIIEEVTKALRQKNIPNFLVDAIVGKLKKSPVQKLQLTDGSLELAGSSSSSGWIQANFPLLLSAAMATIGEFDAGSIPEDLRVQAVGALSQGFMSGVFALGSSQALQDSSTIQTVSKLIGSNVSAAALSPSSVPSLMNIMSSNFVTTILENSKNTKADVKTLLAISTTGLLNGVAGKVTNDIFTQAVDQAYRGVTTSCLDQKQSLEDVAQTISLGTSALNTISKTLSIDPAFIQTQAAAGVSKTLTNRKIPDARVASTLQSIKQAQTAKADKTTVDRTTKTEAKVQTSTVTTPVEVVSTSSTSVDTTNSSSAALTDTSSSPILDKLPTPSDSSGNLAPPPLDSPVVLTAPVKGNSTLLGGNNNDVLYSSPVTANFSANSISGMKLWLDAANPLNISSSTIEYGSFVDTWFDRSGNGNNAIAVSPAKRDRDFTLAANSVISFTGIASYMLPSFLSDGNHDYSAFFVFATFDAESRYLFSSGSPDERDKGISFITSNFFDNGWAGDDLNAGSIFGYTPYFGGSVYDHTSGRSGYLNSASPVSTDSSTSLNFVNKNFFLGSRGDGGNWSGNIYEGMFFDRKLSSDELMLLSLYFQLKYKLNITGVPLNRQKNTLTGGAGADTFVWNQLSNSGVGAGNRDTITDFNPQEGDKIDVSALAVSGNPVVYYKNKVGTSTVLSFDLNGDRIPDLEIELLDFDFTARTITAGTHILGAIEGENHTPSFSSAPAFGAATVNAGEPSGNQGGPPVGIAVMDMLQQFSDEDVNEQGGIGIVATDSTHGTWYYSLNDGWAWSLLPTDLSNRKAFLLGGLVANPWGGWSTSRLYFKPATDFAGVVSQGITVKAWDRRFSTGGMLEDTTVTASGGSIGSQTYPISFFVGGSPTVSANGVPPSNTTVSCTSAEGATCALSCSSGHISAISAQMGANECGNAPNLFQTGGWCFSPNCWGRPSCTVLSFDTIACGMDNCAGVAKTGMLIATCSDPGTAVTDAQFTWIGSGLGNGNFRYKFDNMDFGATTTALVLNPTLDNGLHTIYVQERGAGGAWSATGSAVVTVYKLHAPSGVTTVADETSVTSSEQMPTVNVSGLQSGGTVFLSTAADCSNSIGSASIYEATASVQVSELSALSPGVYNIYAYQTDAYLNTSECSSAHLTYTCIDVPRTIYASFSGGQTLSGGIFDDTIHSSTPTPSTISGLKLWLDASNPLNSSSALNDGEDVDTWHDRSGNSNDALATDLPPTMSTSSLNGKHSVYFDGTTSYSLPNLLPDGNHDYSAFFVFSVSDLQGRFMFSSGLTTEGGGYGDQAVAYLVGGNGFTSSWWGDDLNMGTVSTNQNYIAGVVYNHNSGRSGYLNSTNPSTSSSTALNLISQNFILGGGGNGNFWWGNIFEVLIFDRKLSNAEVGHLNDYLANKYAITIDGIGSDRHRNILTGGTGADTFVWDKFSRMGVGAGNRDIITDFHPGEGDKINVSGLYNGTDVTYFKNLVGTSTVLSFDTNGDRVPDLEIELQNFDYTSTTLTAGTHIIGAVESTNHTPSFAISTHALDAQLQDAGDPVGAAGSQVSKALNGFADDDTGEKSGIAIVGADTTYGSWFYTTDSGLNWKPLQPDQLDPSVLLSTSKAILLGSQSSNALYFKPNGSFTGTLAQALTIKPWDRTFSTSGMVENISAMVDGNSVGGTSNNVRIFVGAGVLLGYGGGHTLSGSADARIIYVSDLPFVKGTQLNESTTIHNLLWLDASDPNGDGSSLAEGATLTSWVDKSGSNYSAIPNTGGVGPNAPLYSKTRIKNLPAFTFDGNQGLVTPLTQALGDVTVFAVFEADPGGQYWNAIVDKSWWSGFSIMRHQGEVNTFCFNGIEHLDNCTSDFTDSTANIVAAGRSGINFAIYANGATTPNASANYGGNAFNNTPVRIGTRNDGGPLVGAVAEVILYDGWLTDTQRRLATEYLGAKYQMGLAGGGAPAANTLTGGTGADIFVYTNTTPLLKGSERDVITDFNMGGGPYNSSEGDAIDISSLASFLNATITYTPHTYLGNTYLSLHSSGARDIAFEILLQGYDATQHPLREGQDILGASLQQYPAPYFTGASDITLHPQIADAGSPVGPVGSMINLLTLDEVISDPLHKKGIAVIGADTSHGSWFYSTDDGITWNALGAVSSSNARLLAENGVTRVYFQPSNAYSGKVINALSFLAWDQLVGASGDLVDLSASGMTGDYTSFSFNCMYASISVGTAVNLPAGGGATVSADTANRVVYVGPHFNHEWFRDASNAVVHNVLWLDASDVQGNGSVTTDLSSVATWKDKSGNSNDAGKNSTGVGTGAPTFEKTGLNGRPALRFSGTDGLKTPINTQFQDMTLFVVFNANGIHDAFGNTDSYRNFEGVIDKGYASSFSLLRPSLDQSAWCFSVEGSIWDTCARSLVPDGASVMLAAGRDGSNFRIFSKNSSSLATKNDGSTSPMSSEYVRIGTRVDGTGLKGYISEVLLFDGWLQDSDRASIYSYLSNKYELPLNGTTPTFQPNTFTGGSGATIYVYSNGSHLGNGSTRDTITDFNTSSNSYSSAKGDAIDVKDLGSGLVQYSFNQSGSSCILSLDANSDHIPDYQIELQNYSCTAHPLREGIDIIGAKLFANSAPSLANTVQVLEKAYQYSGAPVGAIGTLVAQITGGVSDTDGDVKGVAIVSADASKGNWYYTIDGGVTWIAFPNSLSDSNALLLPSNDLARVFFEPTDLEFSGDLSGALVIRAWDQSFGEAGSTVDVNANGGLTPYSNTTVEVSVTVQMPVHATDWGYGGNQTLSGGADNDFILIGAPSFTNSSVSGLILWLDASNPLNSLSSSLSDGASVDTWHDCSGNGNNATAATAAHVQRGNQKGHSSLNFNGTDQYYTLSNGVMPSGNSDYSAFFVFRTSETRTEGLLSGGQYGGGDTANVFKLSNGSLQNYWGSNNASGGSTVSTGVSYIAGFTYDQSVGRKLFLNGANDGANGNINPNFSSNGYAIGRIENGGYWKGDINEILVFDHALSRNELDKVHQYLSNRYGIPLSGGSFIANTLTGGTGADVFKWNNSSFPNKSSGMRDIITDFNSGSGSYDANEGDLIDVSGLALSGITMSYDYYFDSSTGSTIINFDVNNDHLADFQIELTNYNQPVQAKDIFGATLLSASVTATALNADDVLMGGHTGSNSLYALVENLNSGGVVSYASDTVYLTGGGTSTVNNNFINGNNLRILGGGTYNLTFGNSLATNAHVYNIYASGLSDGANYLNLNMTNYMRNTLNIEGSFGPDIILCSTITGGSSTVHGGAGGGKTIVGSLGSDNLYAGSTNIDLFGINSENSMFLDASDVNGDGSSVSNGSGISTWYDKYIPITGWASNSAEQSTEALRPTFVNSYHGKPAVAFNGSQYLVSSSSSTYADMGIVIVAAPTQVLAADTSATVVAVWDTSFKFNIVADENGTNHWRLIYNNFGGYIDGGVVIQDIYTILSVNVYGGHGDFYVNGMLQASFSMQGNSNHTLVVGADASFSNGFTGKIAKVLLYRGPITSNLIQIQSYLGYAYDISFAGYSNIPANSFTGGLGADQFIWTKNSHLGSGSYRDKIIDFNSSSGSYDAGEGDAVDVSGVAISGTAMHYNYEYNSGTGSTILYFDYTGDNASDFEIELQNYNAGANTLRDGTDIIGATYSSSVTH